MGLADAGLFGYHAEIAARMMVQDYPSSAAARDCLVRVMGAVVE